MMDGNPKEWAVAFHGVGEPTGLAVNNIALTGLKIGPRSAFETSTCTRTQKLIGKGVYCTPFIETAE